MEFEVVTSAERPELEEEAGEAFRERWPEFVFHDALVTRFMERVDEYFATYSIFLLSEGRVAAGGWGVPFTWDATAAGLPDGYRTAIVAAVTEHEAGQTPNAFSFMAAAVAPAFDKQGLAARVLEALSERAALHGLVHVVAPIRPTLKHRYPQVEVDREADRAIYREENLWVQHRSLGV